MTTVPNAQLARVFMSYSRRDGMELATRIRLDLIKKGLGVWLDAADLGGGDSWTAAIEEAIDASDVVIAVLTPGSHRSEVCRAEQLRALRRSKCLIPVLGCPGGEIPLHLEARQYRDFSDASHYDVRFAELLQDISQLRGAALNDQYRTTPITYVTAPPMVANFVDRAEAVKAVRDLLFTVDDRRAIALTALEGMGGIGKTVLAQAVCRDEVVQQAFPDGIVWITAGRDAKVDALAQLRETGKALGDDISHYDSLLAAEHQYRTTIASRAALIVIDDVWSKSDLDRFLAESPRSRFVFTTRDGSIAKFTGARKHLVELLDEQQSRELLARWSGTALDFAT